MTGSETFYESLTPFGAFVQFTEGEWFHPLPGDWLVVVTDIRGSTEAVERGRYREVNAIGTASVAAVLNAFKPLSLPYVFGGDGISMAVPPTKRHALCAALAACRHMARESFGLELRVGVVPVRRIRDDGHEILVGKYQPDPDFRQAMFHGGGLAHAESLVKQPEQGNAYLMPEDVEPKADFTGFECRWNEVPSAKEETLTLMVQALGGEDANPAATYRAVFGGIRSIYGDEDDFHPVDPKKLSLSFSSRGLSLEAKIRTSSRSAPRTWAYLLRAWLLNLAGAYLMGRKIRTAATDWGAYKRSLSRNTDYRKCDGTLRMVISGSPSQREQLTAFLEDLHRKGEVVFGLHVSNGAIVTCIVADYDRNHVHFLDGSHGGYAMAARQLKAQIGAMHRANSRREGP